MGLRWTDDELDKLQHDLNAYAAAYDSGLIMLGLTPQDNPLSGIQQVVSHNTVSGTVSGP